MCLTIGKIYFNSILATCDVKYVACQTRLLLKLAAMLKQAFKPETHKSGSRCPYTLCMHMTSTFPGSPQQQLQQGYAGRDDTESLGSCMRAVRCQPYQPQKPCSTATCCPCRAGSNRLCVHARPCKLQMEGQQVGGQWDLAIQFDAMTVCHSSLSVSDFTLHDSQKCSKAAMHTHRSLQYHRSLSWSASNSARVVPRLQEHQQYS